MPLSATGYSKQRPKLFLIGRAATIIARVTSKGQITLPKEVREKLGVQPGEAVGFGSEPDSRSSPGDTGIKLVRSGDQALFLAGSRWAEYARKAHRNRLACSRCGPVFSVLCPKGKAAVSKRFHVLGVLLVGAHALVETDCILSRDLGVYKTSFRDLRVFGSA